MHFLLENKLNLNNTKCCSSDRKVKLVSKNEFKIPKNFPDLSPGEAHVWRTFLDQPDEAVEFFGKILSEKERERAKRFHFEKDCRKFTIARGVLRMLIGKYQNVVPERLKISTGKYGKPAVTDEFNQPEIFFNLSHSDNLAVFAFTRETGIGVDVEQARQLKEMQRIARRFFSKHEYTVLNSLPKDDRTAGFFNAWTRKEAFIKALGEGLSHPLDTFAVTLRPGADARLLWVTGDPAEAAQWSLISWKPAEDYVAALAIRRAGIKISFFEEA